MSGVYGSFIECFPELIDSFYVWSDDDRNDERIIRAAYIPNKGSGIKRRKFTSGNTALDITDDDEIYMSYNYSLKVKEGDYIQKVGDNIIMRLTRALPFDKAAGYRIYTVERVTGATPDKNENLNIKEAVFD